MVVGRRVGGVVGFSIFWGVLGGWVGMGCYGDGDVQIIGAESFQ